MYQVYSLLLTGHVCYYILMFGFFGKNHTRVIRIIGWVLGLVIIVSMVFAYFSILI